MAQTKKPSQKRTAKKNTPPVQHQPAWFTRLGASFARRPHWYVLGLCIAYLGLLQTRFVLSGDTWAEAFGEYVEGAQYHQWQSFFQIGIAGYYNFLPKLISYSYVILDLPMQYIDYYFRAVVTLFTAGAVSFIAHPYNRSVIKNNILRGFLALMTLMIFNHVSTFNLINVWYVAFIPIIFVSLNPRKFTSQWAQIAYVAYALAVCLSKPSLILLPLVIYRAIRFKEYLLGFILTFAITLQSLLFFSSAYYAKFDPHPVDLASKLINLLLAPGLLLLKMFETYPYHLLMVAAASAIIGACVVIVWRSKGFWQTAALGSVFGVSVYTYLYSPDAPPLSIFRSHIQAFKDPMKLQREVLVAFFVLLFLVLAVDYIVGRYGKKTILGIGVTPIAVASLTILTVMQYRPIDTQSSSVSTNIDPFRASLRDKISTCMPIPPTPTWMPPDYKGTTSGWYYQSYGVCAATNYNTVIDHDSFTKPLGAGHAITVPSSKTQQVKALMLPLSNPTPTKARTLQLTNLDTKRSYTAVLKAKANGEALSFVTFNLVGEPVVATAYHYRLTELDQPNSTLTTGIFKYDGRLVHYAYSMPYPNLDDYTHREDRRAN